MSMATQIERDGFLTKPGRIGRGAYFWTAVTNDHLAISTHYAIEWARRARDSWKAYTDQDDESLAVVQVEVEVKEEEILYLDDPELHLEIYQILADSAIKHFNLNSIFDLTRDQFKEIESILYGIIEEYIQIYERALGEYTVKVVFKNQTPPKKGSLAELVGNASCFAVRDTSCISSLHISPAQEGI
ncbi:hypothetical protein [Pseudomonas sp. B392_1p]|uniref:hypothetical protein n=1 Tax=Pseudomonas sp. B392_1p TaxID=3457507 RepID=UPI003FD55D6E